jgi:UDP-glucose 4-epimerase
MKIIITGSESFVARELIAQCLARGIEVFGFDFAKSSDLPYEFVKGDITDPHIADILPKNADAIVHLAALSRDPDCAGKPYECFQANVMGTLNMMRAAQASGTKQFIFASSEWVYEKFVNGEEKDEDAFIDIAGHTSEYALSKLVSETNLRQQYKRGFIPTTILRFAIIYGPRKANWSAVESVMSSVKNNDTVTVGSLKSGRRFLHVSDIASGILASIGRADFQIINLSNDQLVTMADIISESEKIFNKKVNVVESNAAAVSVRNPANKKAKELLGWKPQIDLAAGLQTLVPFV